MVGGRASELMIKIMMTTPVMRRRSRRWWRGDGGGGRGGYLLLNERTPAVAVDGRREAALALVQESPHVSVRSCEVPRLDTPNPGAWIVAGPVEAHKRTITLSCLSDANWQWPL